MSERKSFQKLSDNENRQILEDAEDIYICLIDKYSYEKTENLHMILYTLCASLVCLMKNNIDDDDKNQFLQLVHKILSDNI